MAHGGDLFALGADIPSERNFELAFRGYKPDQVDKCIRLLETENTSLAAERDEAYAHAQALAAQLQQLQLDLVEARQRPSGSTTVTTNVSFRHLGERVGQILALAEDQAAAIRQDAEDSIAAQRAEAERIRRDARIQHDQAIRDFETVLAGRRGRDICGRLEGTAPDEDVQGAQGCRKSHPGGEAAHDLEGA